MPEFKNVPDHFRIGGHPWRTLIFPCSKYSYLIYTFANFNAKLNYMNKVKRFFKKMIARFYPSGPVATAPAQTPSSVRHTRQKNGKMFSPNSQLTQDVEKHLQSTYDFRFNQMTDTTEYRNRTEPESSFRPVNTRNLNTFCIEVRKQGINCWDRDIARYVHSLHIPNFHPFSHFLNHLPAWDGADRLAPLSLRVSVDPLWTEGFHRWMLGMVSQWMNRKSWHANSVAPILISRKQGMHKSTFCKMLLPLELQNYYTDSFDLAAVSQSEQKLSAFGLINLDELDKFSPAKMAQLKNLMQIAGLNIRKAYKKNYTPLPRLASFIATSNQVELLTDPTGSRRFLCVEVHDKIDCSPIDYPQLYAQLKEELLSGARYWFTTEEEARIMENNALFRKTSLEEDVFFSCFRHPAEDEIPVLLSAADIFRRLKHTNPTAMRDASPIRFSKLLTALRIEKVHTQTGNRYKVIELPR